MSDKHDKHEQDQLGNNLRVILILGEPTSCLNTQRDGR